MSLAYSRYENLLRPAYEAYAAIAWTVATIVMVFVVLFTHLPKMAFLYMASGSITFAILRWRQTIALWEYKLSLAGKPFAFMSMDNLKPLMRAMPNDQWMGFGFDWHPQHTQRVMEIRKRDDSKILPPQWFLKQKGLDFSRQQVVGKAWIHGVEPVEKQLFVPLSSVEGHTLVFGTTGAGKTRLYESLISQAILRSEVVIIIDPKGDKELREIARRACTFAGRPEAFLMFHPAFPDQSIRLDTLRNWNNVTEVASRISALMPESGSGDFVSMAWDAINAVSEALVYCDVMPNLMRLRKNIQGGPDALMEVTLRTFFDRNVPKWESPVSALISQARDGKLNQKMLGSNELKAYVHYYKTEIPAHLREPAVDGLLAKVEHNREHLGKILSSLIPLLVQLTAGELGPLLSPDANNLDDMRPIFDTNKLINGGHVFYMGLDSLSNATVGSQIGSVVLADFASVAGSRYNYSDVATEKKIQIFVDEAAEVVNIPLIQILNKARGAGFVVTLAAQTLADFIARMGSEDRARQILGNCNNLIALRTKDRQTQDFIVETLGKTEIQQISRGMGQGTETESDGIDFSSNTSISLKEVEVDLFPPEMLGMLPNLHYIASYAGGRIIKGRLAKLTYSMAK